ncbi:MAG: hypothetical protein QNJ37_18585 [Crocosphaera sp.]|nr:hypothetical protein [Crocosphaera sp.]
MKIKLSFKPKIYTVRFDDKYHVAIKIETENYIHNYSFESFKNAIDLANKILEAGNIDLQYWRQENNKNDIYDKFLICKKKRQTKAHIWTGLDTSCTMWSTGGLGNGKDYNLYNTNLGRDICTMCCQNSKKDN